HRGVVYIRHGEPAARVAAPGTEEHDVDQVASAETPLAVEAMDASAPFEMPGGTEVGTSAQEVWQYLVDGESRILYFAGSDALGTTVPSSLYSYVPLRAALLRRVAAMDPRYETVAFALEGQLAGLRRGMPVQCMTLSRTLRRESRDAMVTSVGSDSYALLFPEPLDPIVQISAVGQPSSGSGRFLVVFAVPGDRLTPAPVGTGGVRYRLGFRISAVDRDHRVIRGLDTLRSFVARDTLPDDAYLSGLFELPVPAGTYDVRVAVYAEDQQAGSAVKLGQVTLGAPRGVLGLSDILLGRESGGLRWENRGDPVMLNALNAYFVGGSAPVYYEAFGLEPGRAYQTTLTVRKVDAGEDEGVSLIFNETADRRVHHIRRTIGLEGLEVGHYRLLVTIEDPETGARATRERRLNIIGVE
ncbi:MAG TPA: hypothetical protein VK012_05310, partial [Gemmatimonadales bacterium]|nr:hypothetical protein [Gemmatimonadales bacterium]